MSQSKEPRWASPAAWTAVIHSSWMQADVPEAALKPWQDRNVTTQKGGEENDQTIQTAKRLINSSVLSGLRERACWTISQFFTEFLPFSLTGKRTLRMSSSLLDLTGAEWAAALFLLALSGEFSKTSPNPRLYHSHNGLRCWGSSPLRTQVLNGGICVFSTPCCNWVSRLVYPTTPNLSLSNPASQELSPVLFPGFFLPMTLCRSVSHGGCSDLRSASLGFTVTMGNRPRTRVNKDSELRVLGTWVHLS